MKIKVAKSIKQVILGVGLFTGYGIVARVRDIVEVIK